MVDSTAVDRGSSQELREGRRSVNGTSLR
jgi:hypothetical protein